MLSRRHFHTFDALRFFAFFKVFLLHMPVWYPPAFAYIKEGGFLGVQFFFVLSGFLITYILAEEKKQYGQLHLKNFYIRRILRIWPLYYLIVAFAFVSPYLLSLLQIAHSDEGYAPNFLFTLSFLENYVVIIRDGQPNVSPLGVIWSVCVEEHFYLIWGLLLHVSEFRRLPRIILVCLVLAPVSRLVFVSNGYDPLDLLTNCDLFACGGLLAYFLIEKKQMFEATMERVPAFIKVGFILLVISSVIIRPHIDDGMIISIVSPTIFALLFSGVLTIVLQEDTLFRIDDRNVLSKLGKYTYGLYLYHTIVLNALTRVYQGLGWSLAQPYHAWSFVCLAVGFSIGISMLSYHFFEQPFLKLRRQFS